MIGVSKLNSLSPTNHPRNLYPSFVGSAGFVSFSPSFTFTSFPSSVTVQTFSSGVGASVFERNISIMPTLASDHSIFTSRSTVSFGRTNSFTVLPSVPTGFHVSASANVLTLTVAFEIESAL